MFPSPGVMNAMLAARIASCTSAGTIVMAFAAGHTDRRCAATPDDVTVRIGGAGAHAGASAAGSGAASSRDGSEFAAVVAVALTTAATHAPATATAYA